MPKRIDAHRVLYDGFTEYFTTSIQFNTAKDFRAHLADKYPDSVFKFVIVKPTKRAANPATKKRAVKRAANPADIWDVLSEDFRGKVSILESFPSASLANEFTSRAERGQSGDRITVKKRTTKKRAANPVPPSTRAAHGTIESQRKKAAKLYAGFTGHEPGDTIMVDKPVYPDVMSVIGDIDGIMYTTVRDGVTEKYIHRFKKNSRPLFCVAPDGLSLYMLGGAYEFGDRGIVDK